MNARCAHAGGEATARSARPGCGARRAAGRRGGDPDRALRGPGRWPWGAGGHVRPLVRPAVGLALLALAGCAPHRIAPALLEPESVRQRFERALARRVERSQAVDQEVLLWARTGAGHALPGVAARLLIAAPAAFRLRVASPFGVALDAAAAADSLVFHSPRERVALVLPSAAESIGVRDIGSLGCRLWSATWRPSRESWEGRAWEDSLLVVRWREGEDSLKLAIGSSGLPASIVVGRAGAGAITARYAGWAAVDGIQWPARADCADDAGRFEISSRIQRVRFEARMDPERLRIEFPERTRRVTLAEVAARLARLLPH
jgi:hypothetical protein